MPKMYERMRDSFAKEMSYDAAQTKAARIYNDKNPDNTVTSKSDKKKKKKAVKKLPYPKKESGQ